MKKIICIFITFTFSFSTFAKCQMMETQKIFMGKVTSSKIELCKTEVNKIAFFHSKNCGFVNNNLACIDSNILKKYREGNKPEALGEGSPGFVSCRKLGGNSEILKVKNNNRWEEMSLCHFKNEFAETSIVVEMIKSLN